MELISPTGKPVSFFIGKGGIGLHELTELVMSKWAANGGRPDDYAIVGEVIAQMLQGGGYTMKPFKHGENGRVFTSWMLIREAKDCTGIPGSLPDAHREGMFALDSQQWVVDGPLLDWIVEKVLPAFPTKEYTRVDSSGVSVKYKEKSFLVEYCQRWELEGLFKAKGSQFSFTHGTDSRAGRIYASPFFAGKGCQIPTTDSGDITSLMLLAEPVKVSKSFCRKVWLPFLCQKWEMKATDIIAMGTDPAAWLRCMTHPTGKLHGVGAKKRNILEFIQDCRQIGIAAMSGKSQWHMGNDAHAQGFVLQSLALGTPICKKVAAGADAYQLVGSEMHSLGLHADLEEHLKSRDWAKAVTLAGVYTAKHHHGSYTYGVGHEVPIVDSEGRKVFASKFGRSVLNREKFTKHLQPFVGESDSNLHTVIEAVSKMSAMAFFNADPQLGTFIKDFLEKAQDDILLGIMPEFTYGGFKACGFKVAPALDWFPADKFGFRDGIKNISITIPEADKAFMTSRGWPTRFQPTVAPFYMGEVDQGGYPVLPYKATGEVNLGYTANSVLTTPVSICDSEILLRTVGDMEVIQPGSVAFTRHDAISVRPGKAYQSLAAVFAGHMHSEATGPLNAALSQILGRKIRPTTMTHSDMVANAGNFVR